MHYTDKEVGCDFEQEEREYLRRGSIQTDRIKAQIDHLNIALIDTINQINNQDVKLSSSDYKAFISHVQSFAQNLRNNLSEAQIDESGSQQFKDVIRVCYFNNKVITFVI